MGSGRDLKVESKGDFGMGQLRVTGQPPSTRDMKDIYCERNRSGKVVNLK